MDHIDKIYCLVHPVYEKQRMARLMQQIQDAKIPSEKVAYGAATWGTELNADLIWKLWDPFLRPGVPNLTWKSRCLSKGEISLVLNFYAAAKDAVEKKYTHVLFFESDVFLRSDFLKCFTELWQDLPEQWDYVSLGEGVGTRPEKAPISYFAPVKVYKPPHQAVFRCTDSMLFRVSFLEKVLTTLFPFRECLDWELNFQLALHQGIALWADPPLAEQGSGRMRDITCLPA